ncbi:MAG: hypothetical protein ACLTYN_01225 [Dysosmobacter welbionis]
MTDKFAGRAAETDSNGNPYLKEHMVSRIACKVVDQMEIGSFLLSWARPQRRRCWETGGC